MPLEQSDFDRIQTMIDRTLPRLEYEQRHSILANEVKDLKASIKELALYGLTEHEKIRTDYQLAVKEIRMDIKEVKDGLSSKQDTNMRYVVSQIVTFFIGGGLVGIIEFFRNGR